MYYKIDVTFLNSNKLSMYLYLTLLLLAQRDKGGDAISKDGI